MSDGLWNQVKGNWKQFAGGVQEKWGELTGDEIDQIDGDRQQLVGKIQERYGMAQEEAEKQVDDWADSIKDAI
ncbi:MAG: CsbD family protein [Phototrophicaceae bacterium]